jgi:hypothetical protein
MSSWSAGCPEQGFFCGEEVFHGHVVCREPRTRPRATRHCPMREKRQTVLKGQIPVTQEIIEMRPK